MATPPWFVAHGISVDYPGPNTTRLWHKAAPLRAVHSASLALNPGQTVAIIGESGSGKSTLGRALVQLVRPAQGVVQLGDTVVSDLWGPAARHHRPSAALRAARRRLQMIFQDSWASLDPTQSIGQTIGEPLAIEGRLSPQHMAQRVQHLLAEVGLDASLAQRLPHALSGGQRQRVNIARALCAEPSIIVADEPTSALDVSVKGHVLFMLQALVRTRQMGLVFISHDLPSVRFIAQRVSVMYAGRVIETGPTEAVFKAAKHPYTQALLEAAPQANPLAQNARLHRAKARTTAQQPATSGCPYRLSCPRRIAQCDTTLPALTGVDEHHTVACHRAHGDG